MAAGETTGMRFGKKSRAENVTHHDARGKWICSGLLSRPTVTRAYTRGEREKTHLFTRGFRLFLLFNFFSPVLRLCRRMEITSDTYVPEQCIFFLLRAMINCRRR